VLDLATVVAGPGAARYLADFGADVLKIERPGAGDSTRTMGLPDPRDGTSLYWKVVGRNKRCATLDLKSPDGRDALLRLADEAHVLIENFRPGVLERLGLGPDVLLEHNPRLVVCRVTAFGQDGPYAQRPGFATLAEAMSGFAAINGEADRGPLLPPIALTDEVTALAAAFAIMVALHSGVGQVVDVTLLESLLQCMGPLPSAYGTTGFLQPRRGSSLPYSVPRGTWRCRDGRWVAVSASAESVGRRVMELIGLEDREDLRSFGGRIAARDEIDARMAEFCAARTVDRSSPPSRRRTPPPHPCTTWRGCSPIPRSWRAAASSRPTVSPCPAWSRGCRGRPAPFAGPAGRWGPMTLPTGTAVSPRRERPHRPEAIGSAKASRRRWVPHAEPCASASPGRNPLPPVDRSQRSRLRRRPTRGLRHRPIACRRRSRVPNSAAASDATNSTISKTSSRPLSISQTKCGLVIA
jgi:crotonobetainyl-CoA:carnitine CoA-transferase CaiB-like acyl-CoA transferase